jgi:DNA sulfur modification protein DndD
MIISSISMKNFQCYSGEHESNTLHFSDGLNLIIGDNGGGKSKLYDAFYWVIHNQVFQSDQRQMINTRIYKDNLISDKAKANCPIGETISAEVALIVTSTNDKKYKLERIFKAKKLADREWESDIDSTMLISEYKHTKWNLLPSAKYTNIINRVIPGHIKPYMWFQGEQVDSLMDLADSSALSQVVGLLSDISDYDDLISIAKNGANKASKELKKHKSNLSSDETLSKSLNSDLEGYDKDIKKLNSQIDQFDTEIEEAKLKVEELISKVDDAEAKANYKSEKKALEDRYKSLEKKLLNANNNSSKGLFQKHWILKNIPPFFKKFDDKYKQYTIKHNEKVNAGKTNEIKLPLNMPRPVHVEQMIDDESCYVCGRSAPKGSEAHEHIISLIKRKPSKNIFENDFSNEFESLYNNNLRYGVAIDGIDESIISNFKNIVDIKNRLTTTANDIKEIDNQFDILIEEDKSEDILKSYKQHNENKEKFERIKIKLSRELETALKEKENVQSRIDKLVTGEIDKVKVAADFIFSNLEKLAKSTKQHVFESIISELEGFSNEIFNDMTEKNTSIKGQIKFKKLGYGVYIPEIVDSDGYIINSPNDSNIILVKLALIMAILTARAKWSDNYSLISDAPTSKMAENYTFGFYKTLSNRFKQSIVTTYDFLEDDRKEALHKFNIGKVYQIEPSSPAGDSDNRSDLSVNIREVLL